MIGIGISLLNDELQLAVTAISNNEIVGIPTETVYGIGVNPTSQTAVNKIFELKDLNYTGLELKPAADVAIAEDSYFYTFYTRSGPSGTLVELDKSDETTFEALLTGDTELIVDLWLASTTSTTLGSQDIDFGVDSLGLQIEGDASIDFATTFVLDIGLGASLSRGFFIS